MDETERIQGLKRSNFILATAILSITLVWVIPEVYLSISNPEVDWDWKSINTSDIHFPSSFAWGTATAAHQVEGNNTNNNWYQWEHSVDENNISRIHNNDKSGIAADHWNRYPEDIKLMKELGVNHYRFSVEWSKIEPKNDVFNQDALSHYRKL